MKFQTFDLAKLVTSHYNPGKHSDQSFSWTQGLVGCNWVHFQVKASMFGISQSEISFRWRAMCTSPFAEFSKSYHSVKTSQKREFGEKDGMAQRKKWEFASNWAKKIQYFLHSPAHSNGGRGNILDPSAAMSSMWMDPWACMERYWNQWGSVQVLNFTHEGLLKQVYLVHGLVGRAPD